MDSLLSAEKKANDKCEMSSDLFSETDEDRRNINYGRDPYGSDSSGNGTHFKNRTGIFTQDFPPSPKVSKGKGKKTKVVHIMEPVNSDSD